MRFFEILDQMNQNDTNNGTHSVPICGQDNIISVNMYNHHGDIKFGIPHEMAAHLTLKPERYRAILVVVDMDEYNKINPTDHDNN